MSSQPTQAVFFDAAGTLFRVRGSVGEVYGRVAAEFGFQPTPETDSWKRLGQAFLRSFQAREPMLFPEGAGRPLAEMERDWWREVVRATFAGFGPFPRFEEFFREVYDFFGTARPWDLEPGCRELLTDLRKRGLKLGVISNFDSRLEGLLAALQIRDCFDSVTISSVCGAAKPDPRIFRHALKAAGAAASRSIHVGDDWEDDWTGAEGVGMRALLFDPSRRWADRPGVRIGRLEEVLDFLL